MPPADDGAHPTRAHIRVARDAFVRVVGAERDYPFRTRDLSEGGVFLYTRIGHLYPFTTGAELVVEIPAGEETLAVTGRVVRVVEPGSPEAERYPAGFGVRFDAIDDKTRIALRGLIRRGED